MANRVKDLLNEQANVRLARLGLTDRMIRDVKREAWWWLKARGEAARKPARLYRGSAVVWTDSGRCELAGFDEPGPGPEEATIRIETSVVSPGTERAQYLRLPNAQVSYPHRPGYSAAGIVVAVGRRVVGIEPGGRVALAAPHASLATVDQSRLFCVPDCVDLPDAAFIQLGVIASQGVGRARIRVGQPVCVVGAGIVGLLAQRMAAAEGAGPITVIANSRRQEQLALAGGAVRFVAVSEEPEATADIAAPVVIEATGDPTAIGLALNAAGDGGSVVLLGSPRGMTPNLPVTSIRARRLRVVGAHISTLWRGRRDEYHDAGDAFLERLANGSVKVADLVGSSVDPRECGRVYRNLAAGELLGTPSFDWSLLSSPERVARRSYARPPDLSARGVEYERRPLRGGRSRLAADEGTAIGTVGRLRLGLLGCGDIAGQNAAAVAAAPNAELVACYDPEFALAEDLGSQYGADALPSREALLERSDIDAVFLAVPHHLHAPLALDAIRAGKHVIVEKPPASTLAEAVEMAAAADDAGVVLTICFPQRYLPSVAAARRLVAAGALGEFEGSLMSFLSDKPASYWLGGFSGRSSSDWRLSKEKAGGGVLIMNLSHHIDVVRHLAGVEVSGVTAQTGIFDGHEVEDAVAVAVRYENGAIGSVFGSSAVRGTWEGRTSTELRLWGKDGHIAVDGSHGVFTLRALAGVQPARWQTFGRLHSGEIRAIFVSRLAQAVAEGRRPDVTAADGLAVQAFIEAAYRSSELRREVSPAELLREAGA